MSYVYNCWAFIAIELASNFGIIRTKVSRYNPLPRLVHGMHFILDDPVTGVACLPPEGRGHMRTGEIGNGLDELVFTVGSQSVALVNTTVEVIVMGA